MGPLEVAARRASGGYEVEMRLPATSLLAQPPAGRLEEPFGFDVQIDEVRGRGFTVQAIIFEESQDGLILRQVLGSPNAILKSREDAMALSEDLAREWITENA